MKTKIKIKVLITLLFITSSLKGQPDTILDYNNVGSAIILCDNSHMLDQGVLDTGSCYLCTIYNTNIHSLFFYRCNYFTGEISGEGYAIGKNNYHKIIFLKIKRKGMSIVKTGQWSFYYPTGIEKSNGSFLDGEKNGAWKYFSENGKLDKEEIYDSGSLNLIK